LLQFLAREIGSWRLLILGTYRDVELRRQHPLAQTLAELAREQVSSRVVLRGLTEDDVSRYIEMTAGIEPPADLVRAVHRETEGNPFFVSEIVRLLASEGKFEGPVEGSWSISIPQSVREVVGRRLDQLSDSANGLLRIASVVGREFALGVVQAVSDLDPGAVREAVEEAREARVIAEAPRTVDRYIFSHALIRETLYEEIPTARRVMIHRRIGEVLETLTRDAPDATLAELAHHFLEAAPGGDVGKAVSYAERAAARASSQLAYEEATRHLLRALDAMELEAPDPARRCAVLLALGEAERRAGDVGAARDAFFSAAEIARASGDFKALADAAIGLQAGAQFGTVDERRVVILEQALDMAGDRDLALRSRLLGHLARALYFSPDFEHVRALAQETVGVAESANDRIALAEALSTRAYVLWGIEPPEQRVVAGDRIVEIARRVDDTELLLDGLMWRIIGLTESGDVFHLPGAIDVYTRAAESSRITRYQLYAISRQAMLAALTGRFSDAERLSDEAYEIGVRAQEPDAIQVYTGQKVMRAALVGDRAAIEWGLRALDEYTRGYAMRMLWIHLFRAFAYLGLGEIEAAKREFRPEDVRGIIEAPPQGIAFAMSLGMAAEIASRLGDTATADVLYEQLLPYERRVIAAGGAVFCIGLGARYLGLLATMMGRLDDADRHLTAAMAMCEEMGALPWLAETLYDHAAMLLARGGPGDTATAVAELDRSLALAHELGMAPLAERAVTLKLDAQGASLPADVRTSIDRVASAVETEQPDLRTHAAPDGTVTLLFTDIEGSTALNERLGDRRWIELLRTHNSLIREQVSAHGGFEVKSQGDGFMLAFSSARRGLACAIEIQRALGEHAAKNPDEAIRVRIGLHTGEAIAEAGDFYGRHVNLAARVGAVARGGEILVSSLLRELTASSGEFEFDEGRDVQLKGLAGTHRVHAVRW
jgi:class 3 adenylate cyclase